MLDSFSTLKTMIVGDKTYHYFSLPTLASHAEFSQIHRLPYSLKVLLENLLRHEDNKIVNKKDLHAFAQWLNDKTSKHEIAYYPARVLMQDFTGVPAVVDLAAMRDAMRKLQGNPAKINPHCPVDLVIDHSVQVDAFGNANAFTENVRFEMQRNFERYSFLKWGQKALNDFRVVPPGTGICHQVNLEYLGKGVWSKQTGEKRYAFPDTLVGTDSHTTMINGLGVLGWGVGGIEAEAAMLGQPISMLIPEVIGFRLVGQLNNGITATDLVLTVTQMLREHGVVGKFVEFFGPGLKELPVADRATISNMSPEYGATCGIFPLDQETIRYLRLTNRDQHTQELVEAYAKQQGLWHDDTTPEAVYTHVLELNLSQVVPSLAGPKRPQDRVPVPELARSFEAVMDKAGRTAELHHAYPTSADYELRHGDVVIAAITSCTNTSNPSVMLGAGLVAKKAVEKGLTVKPWVKTSLAPGSKVVTDYLARSGLIDYLQQLDFYLVGYGCTTCIGNSGPLPEPVAQAIEDNDLIVSGVLSGNRNFEGRIHPLVKANWLASPPLVVAYALAGTTRIDLTKEPLGEDKQGNPVYLKDIWPSNAEVAAEVQNVSKQMFQSEYAQVFDGDSEWQAIEIPQSDTYEWDAQSTYVKNPPFFDGMQREPEPCQDITNARILALLGDSVTTDHISPAGAIPANSPAGQYLQEQGIAPKDFNSYGSRRGNHEVLWRGTFANIRIRNEMLNGKEGGFTKHFPDGKETTIFDAAMEYKKENTPLVVIAGKEYGTGSSRDWAAKGTLLLGVKAVIAESFERIHRSNLIGMGVLPLQFQNNASRKTLKLDGSEIISLTGIADNMRPGAEITVTIQYADGREEQLRCLSRIDTQNELEYYENGGILQYVLRRML